MSAACTCPGVMYGFRNRKRSRLSLAVLLVMVTTSCGCAGNTRDNDEVNDDDDNTSVQSFDEEEGTLTTQNAIGRSGSYFLPARTDTGPIPLLVGYHGTGGDGSGFLPTFVELAREQGFAIVAPDSRQSPDGQYTWEVGDHAGEVTPDYTHTLDCIDEVRGRDDVTIEDGRILTAGFSGGASSAPYIATNEDLFSAFAVLHGGVIAGGIGDHIVPGWFATGEDDTLRSPDHLQGHLDSMTALGFTELELHVYPGGHSIGTEEAGDLVSWWLAL